MAESTPERGAYLPPHARSQASTNWRTKEPQSPTELPFRGGQGQGQQNRRESETATGNADAGTRLYVGNLLYTASREDVEAFFTEHGFTLSGISMSIDPFTQRNPSYAFVDFSTAEEANKALETVNGRELLGREVRVNVGVRKSQGTGERRVRNFADGTFQQDRRTGNSSPAFDRFSRTDQAQHNSEAQSKGLRLYVGGLPRIEPQSACEETVREIFNASGLEVAAVSKIISPHPSKLEEPGNHHYCFVDMNTAIDIDTAVEKLHGFETEWGPLRVGRAKDNQDRKPQRESYQRQGYERQGSDRRERDGPRVEERASWR